MYLAGQVPAGSSASDRRRASAECEPAPAAVHGVVGLRSARAMLSAVAALLALSVAVALLSASGHPLASDADGAQPPAPGAPLAAPGKLLYRLVGCRSDGAAAHREGPRRKWVAISFDDGPWSDTPAFVTMLERSHAPATFFMIGRQLSTEHRSLLLRELRDGDVLGDHTFTHPDLTQTRDVRSQLVQTIAAIRALTGYTPCVFRPPYGSYNKSVLRTAHSLGLATILWNVDPADYTQPGAGAIEARVLAQVRPGSIVISHDGGGPRAQTLAAYPGIIRKLRARGYRIVTVLEMLGYRPVYEPCVKLCEGIGITKRSLPRDALVVRAP